MVTAPTRQKPTSPLVGAAICRPPSGQTPTQRQRNSVREPFVPMPQQGRSGKVCGGRGPGVGEPGPCSFVYFLQEIHKKTRAWPSPSARSGAECGNPRLCHPERSEGTFKIPRHCISRDDSLRWCLFLSSAQHLPLKGKAGIYEMPPIRRIGGTSIVNCPLSIVHY